MRSVAVIPALNEYHHLSRVISETAPYVDHIVIIDDGSKEPLMIHLESHPKLSILRHSINLGKGAALKTGVLWALRQGFDAAVFLDADGQHDPNEIPLLLQPIIEGRSDIVFGVRQFHGKMPFVARLGNFALTKAVHLLYGIRVTDTQSGYRALRLSAFEKLAWHSPRYAVETEMIVNTGKQHLAYAQVPISTIYLDKYKGTTVIDGVRIMINMITWRFL